jgi:two-component system NtrC family sensor kinase
MFARIMASPPGDFTRIDSDTVSAVALARLAAFARAATGMLRPFSLLDRLLQELKATFAPAALAAVIVDQQGQQESARGDNAHPLLASLLQEVLRTGAPATRAGDQWSAAAPLVDRGRLRGAVGMVLEPGAAPADTRLLEAFAAVAAVALAGADLAVAADFGRQRWEEALDAISLGLCLLDRQGMVDRANRGFTDLLGLPPGGAAGRPWAELVPAGWREAITRALAEPARQQEVRLGQRAIAVTAFRAGAEGAGRAILVFEDQTDRHRLQDRLIQAEKLSAIGQLIAGVAHDLNNPLTSVVGFADFLAEAPDVPARIREPLRVIQQEAERASKIVKNLLSFARRQEARQTAGIRPILEATLGLFRNQLSADRIALELVCPPDLPDLELNPNQIQQVFVNLIQNAAQAILAADRPGSVRVTARRWMDGVAVDVADDGPGMPPDVAARVFEPFFTTKPEGRGTGLGLSISQGIAREHGGRITLATGPGVGSTFTVELPGPVRPPVRPEPVPEPPASRPLTVLVLDDEPHILHYIRATLEAWGHTVVTATDGVAGLDLATRESFDLIISDLRMPRLGGREFYSALAERAPAAARRVAFSTGDTVRGDTLGFLEASGRPCLQKPFSLSELRALLRDAARG